MLLETLYATGIRRFELAALKLQDLDLARGAAMIRQFKGAKDRAVPLGERCQAWIEKYLREVRLQLVVEPDDGTVFRDDLHLHFPLQHPLEGDPEATERFGPADGTVKVYDLDKTEGYR